MDDLDRLYFEFVEITRRERGTALTDPMTVLELHDELVPYRRVRDPADLRSNDDYEFALSRLLAGERGYVLSDGNMQDEVRAGLEETLPDIRRYRAFPDARVWLNPEKIPPPGDIRFAPPEVRDRAEWYASRAAADPASVDSQVDEAVAADEGAGGAERHEVLEPDDATILEAYAETGPVEEAATYPGQSAQAQPVSEDTADNQDRVSATTPAMEAASALEICPNCSTDTPAGASYCPFCGVKLAPQTCEACGAELESAWRFCSSCGAPRSEE